MIGRSSAFILAFLPPLFAAVLILVVGWVVANFLSQGLLIAAVNAGLPEARLLARAVHWGVLLFAGATALTHLGIGKEMVLVAFGITFGGLVFALALAFGTIAIPLAIDDALTTTLVWALEGAGVYWVGTRQQRWLARAS